MEENSRRRMRKVSARGGRRGGSKMTPPVEINQRKWRDESHYLGTAWAV
jgi:hypothetical protein